MCIRDRDKTESILDVIIAKVGYKFRVRYPKVPYPRQESLEGTKKMTFSFYYFVYPIIERFIPKLWSK